MYFIQPSRSIPCLDQALNELPSLQIIQADDLDLYDQTIIAIADVQDFLKYQWKLPTIVLAFEDEGAALAQAWEMGALAGWIWNNLPKIQYMLYSKLMRNTNEIKIVVIFLQQQHYRNVYYRTQ
jgi:hypothetical protein